MNNVTVFNLTIDGSSATLCADYYLSGRYATERWLVTNTVIDLMLAGF